jgi:hypothetical protein
MAAWPALFRGLVESINLLRLKAVVWVNPNSTILSDGLDELTKWRAKCSTGCQLAGAP